MQPHMLLSLALLLVSVPDGVANEEGPVVFQKFRVEGVSPSFGPVVVSGTQGEKGITSLQIDAFNRSFIVSADQLKELHDLTINGLHISCAFGSPKTGNIIYVVLSTGYTSGPTDSKYVQVQEHGSIKVGTSP
jgi:hypothetical protein